MKDIKPTPAHIERAREWVAANSAQLMSGWIEDEAKREIIAARKSRRDPQTPGRSRIENIGRAPEPGDDGVEVHAFLNPDEIQGLIRAHYMRLQAAAIERQVELHARGYVEIEARAIEQKRRDDELHTCPVCGEVRPDFAVARRVEDRSDVPDFISCWACFVTARQISAESLVSPARVKAVKQVLVS